ncbi:MAG: sulfatase-like hydrolase/transferase [Victivallaceae bacterium]
MKKMLFSSILVTAAVVAGSEPKKLNVLLITGDHTRHDALACNLDKNLSFSLAQVVKTPNFDRRASQGVSLVNSYSANPICVPGRACIMLDESPQALKKSNPETLNFQDFKPGISGWRKY